MAIWPNFWLILYHIVPNPVPLFTIPYNAHPFNAHVYYSIDNDPGAPVN